MPSLSAQSRIPLIPAPPALPVTVITPARENYHCLGLLEADNGERNHAF